ncbi:MAG: hypothetical protein AAGC63_15640 [Propionicimonas sp.]
MNPHDALSLGILALNTLTDPAATTPGDLDALDSRTGAALAALGALRDEHAAPASGVASADLPRPQTHGVALGADGLFRNGGLWCGSWTTGSKIPLAERVRDIANHPHGHIPSGPLGRDLLQEIATALAWRGELLDAAQAVIDVTPDVADLPDDLGERLSALALAIGRRR